MTVPQWIVMIGGTLLLLYAIVILPWALARAPRNRRVLLYSGGKTVREWRVTGHISWSAGFVTFHDPATNGKVVLGGAGIVIEDVS